MPFAAAFDGSQLRIVENVVSNDVLLDHSRLSRNDFLHALTRGKEDNATIFVLNQIIALRDTPVRHWPGHLDMLNDAFVALVVRDVRDCQLAIQQWNHRDKVVPEVRVLF